jgi:hypothetical protein
MLRGRAPSANCSRCSRAADLEDRPRPRKQSATDSCSVRPIVEFNGARVRTGRRPQRPAHPDDAGAFAALGSVPFSRAGFARRKWVWIRGRGVLPGPGTHAHDAFACESRTYERSGHAPVCVRWRRLGLAAPAPAAGPVPGLVRQPPSGRAPRGRELAGGAEGGARAARSARGSGHSRRTRARRRVSSGAIAVWDRRCQRPPGRAARGIARTWWMGRCAAPRGRLGLAVPPAKSQCRARGPLGCAQIVRDSLATAPPSRGPWRAAGRLAD